MFMLSLEFVRTSLIGSPIDTDFHSYEMTAKSRDELNKNFYVARIQSLVEEILGLMVTPVLLLVYFPKASLDICNFFRHTLFESEELGDWCSLGCFELDMTDPRLSRDGKLEKSAISFALTYMILACLLCSYI